MTLASKTSLTDNRNKRRCCIIVMGVSGSGKTTLAAALASSLNMHFVEGDTLHPKSNIDKMSSGQPLTDHDRKPWLELVRKKSVQYAVQGLHPEASGQTESCGVVITCSALKKSYRDILRGRFKPVVDHIQDSSAEEQTSPLGESYPNLSTYFVYVKGKQDVILKRLKERKGHFMKSNMLTSQFQDLESPEGEDEHDVVVVDAEESTEHQVENAKRALVDLEGWFLLDKAVNRS